VRTRDELRLIPVEEITCFVAEQKYTTLRHAGGEELIEESLKALEEKFASRFVRVHRNSLVAIAHIEGLERDTDGHQAVRLRGGATLHVSRRLAADVLKRLSR
jgi:two-component system response regulator AlgR